jgi:hypothetical protein
MRVPGANPVKMLVKGVRTEAHDYYDSLTQGVIAYLPATKWRLGEKSKAVMEDCFVRSDQTTLGVLPDLPADELKERLIRWAGHIYGTEIACAPPHKYFLSFWDLDRVHFKKHVAC